MHSQEIISNIKNEANGQLKKLQNELESEI